jgi:hypothetical protein
VPQSQLRIASVNEAEAGSSLRDAVRSFDTYATALGLLAQLVERLFDAQRSVQRIVPAYVFRNNRLRFSPLIKKAKAKKD